VQLNNPDPDQMKCCCYTHIHTCKLAYVCICVFKISKSRFFGTVKRERTKPKKAQHETHLRRCARSD